MIIVSPARQSIRPAEAGVAGGANVHKTDAQQEDQTDLDAHLEVQVPEYHGREDGQEEIRG